MKHHTLLVISVAIPLIIATVAFATFRADAGTIAGGLEFSNTPLLFPGSEPAISIGSNGTMGITGLSWEIFGTNLWTGLFGTTPTYEGFIDLDLQQAGKSILGGGDADVDIGATGTLHASTLIGLVNSTLNSLSFGVSAITCPSATAPSFNGNNCTKKIIDTTTSDRPWITSEGTHVYIAYRDPSRAATVHVQRSDDDGFTWRRVGDPITGQGRATADATFNNIHGPIVADPFTHNVYMIYTAGEPGFQKATSFAFNNVFVSRSTDHGKTWTANMVFHAPLFTRLNHLFPALAVDPTNGKLYAVWTDAQTIWFSASSDQGSHWSAAVGVNIVPANTAVMPWVAAYNGTVDVVYYATDASSKDDQSAVWNVYLAQTTDDGANFTQSLVSNTPNHVGVVCTNGTSCPEGTRNLAEVLEVAIDPQSGHAGIVYADDTLLQDGSGNPLPEIVFAQQQ